MNCSGSNTKQGKEYCVKCAKHVLLWTIAGNVFLSFIKLVGGTFANSSAMVADGFQSLSCVATSILITLGVFISRREKDEKFPYGYAKLEFIISLGAFSVLIGLGIFIVLSNLIGVLRRDIMTPDIVALPIVLTSVFITYMMYRYNLCAGTRLNSPAIIANGYNAGADLLSSAAVILAIIVAQFGPQFAVLDRIAALIVGIMIIKDSLGHWLGNLEVMLDQVPDRNIKNEISAAIKKAGCALLVSNVKFKRIGAKFWVGICLEQPPQGTVGDYALVIRSAREALLKHIPSIEEADFFL